MSSSDFLTVNQAADFCGVTVKTIYYHINKSEKLRPINLNGSTMILEDELLRLYPARNAGKKQFLRETKQTRENLILEISNLISANAQAGNFATCESLARTLRFV